MGRASDLREDREIAGLPTVAGGAAAWLPVPGVQPGVQTSQACYTVVDVRRRSATQATDDPSEGGSSDGAVGQTVLMLSLIHI